jgi:hypothetical protein
LIIARRDKHASAATIAAKISSRIADASTDDRRRMIARRDELTRRRSPAEMMSRGSR